VLHLSAICLSRCLSIFPENLEQRQKPCSTVTDKSCGSYRVSSLLFRSTALVYTTTTNVLYIIVHHLLTITITITISHSTSSSTTHLHSSLFSPPSPSIFIHSGRRRASTSPTWFPSLYWSPRVSSVPEPPLGPTNTNLGFDRVAELVERLCTSVSPLSPHHPPRFGC
jgi:hypothetical protein